MKHTGLRRAVRAQLGRRCGLKGTKMLSAEEIDGAPQSLRGVEASNTTGYIESNRNPNQSTGGYTAPVEFADLQIISKPIPCTSLCLVYPPLPATLLDSFHIDDIRLLISPPISPHATEETDEFSAKPISQPANPGVGLVPTDIDFLDFAQPDEELRSSLSASTIWLFLWMFPSLRFRMP